VHDCTVTTRWRVYLAGPMSGVQDYNYPLFAKVADRIRREKEWEWEVVSPAEMDNEDGIAASLNPDHGRNGFLVKNGVRAKFLRRDFRILSECDGIVLLPEWFNSTGANCELAVARMMGLTIYEYVEWANGGWGLREADELMPKLSKVMEQMGD